MELRYKESDYLGYEINCSNIAFFRFRKNYKPYEIYKSKSFGLFFYTLSINVTNNQSGIKIEKIWN